MALMLRLEKIPSRIVAGYSKGEWNEPAKAIVMREDNAHAWVEAYIPGQGWLPFDPTPSGATEPSAGRNLLHELAQYWDYFGLMWNRFVIQYDLYSQVRAFENLRGTSGRLGAAVSNWWSRWDMRLHPYHHATNALSDENRDRSLPIPYKNLAIFATLVLISLFLIQRRRYSSANSAIRFYEQFLEQMAHTGFPKRTSETGWEFAQRLGSARPQEKTLVWNVTERYYEERFTK
jgi:hypothetical protein